MLSNHIQNGMETAKLAWSRLPNSEEAEVHGGADFTSTSDGNGAESLDYEVIENYAYREEQAQRGKFLSGYYVVLKWLLALLIGIGFVVYILLNLVLVFSSVFIITQFAPAAAGSGIPEIKGYLNGVDTHGILLFRTLIGKILGSIGSVGGGLALGKEGPLVHTGACIASLLGKVGSTKYHLRSRWLQVFQSDRDCRDLVTCGCAAGVAAAFRAPVGGVLFALEEVTSWWRSQLMWRVFFTSAVVAVVIRTAMTWCGSGKCGHFGSGGFIIWDVSGGQEDYSFEELLPMAFIGVIGGLLGALFNQLTLYITRWRRQYLHKKGNRVKIIEVCLVSLLTSTISFGLPLLRKCSPCPESEANSGMECPRPPGMYGNYVRVSFQVLTGFVCLLYQG
ncbi:chloride channel protein CLC-d-like isoform X2 [Macadamia integrifolia]|uniref:chloride channel protein CLC-d-like isoform X2 n=1 Tax=Macadamia integrifolia TaxID=60698 RepID=UPI001C4E6D19|nr:chloride channel protein CLC-d-like isoform X2 [Macadamia integrifolia]